MGDVELALEDTEVMEDFYGESEGDEPKPNTEIDGITGKVTQYTYTGISYPCVIFKKGYVCPLHKLTIVSNMVKSGMDTVKDVDLYTFQGDDLMKMGSLSGLQMKGFLDLMGTDGLEGFFDSETQLSGSKLYTLCSPY